MAELQDFEDIFPKEHPRGFPLLGELSIKLTLCQVHDYQTRQLIEATPRIQ